MDDLVENEVLVVKERVSDLKTPPPASSSSSWDGHKGRGDPFHRSRDQAVPTHMTTVHGHVTMVPGHVTAVSSHVTSVPAHMIAKGSVIGRSRGAGGDHTPSSSAPLTAPGVPQLSHFIQCNSFGYYFLAEAENVRFAQSQGKSRRAHCIVKVPHLHGE